MQANSLAEFRAAAAHKKKYNVKLRLLACVVLHSILALNAMTV